MTFAELSNQPMAAIRQMKIVLKETLFDIFIFFKEQKESETKIYVRTSPSTVGMILLSQIIFCQQEKNNSSIVCSVSQCNCYGHNSQLSLICIISIFSITFLSLTTKKKKQKQKPQALVCSVRGIPWYEYSHCSLFLSYQRDVSECEFGREMQPGIIR